MNATLLCATTNANKFAVGKASFAKHGITLEQIVLDIDEIQGEDSEKIAIDKARRAFEQVQKPLLVTDDSWSTPALKGFPGPYAKSMNAWLTAQDFLQLMHGKTDRTIYLQQYVVYIDKMEVVLFQKTLPGTITSEPKGNFPVPLTQIVSLDHFPDGKTISEMHDDNLLANRDSGEAWADAAVWYAKKIAL